MFKDSFSNFCIYLKLNKYNILNNKLPPNLEMMSIAKYLFRKALENKMVVVTDYYDIMESKRKREKEENHKQL